MIEDELIYEDIDLTTLESEQLLPDAFDDDRYNRLYLDSLLRVLKDRNRHILEDYYSEDYKAGKGGTLETLSEKYGLTKESIYNIVKSSLDDVRKSIVRKAEYEDLESRLYCRKEEKPENGYRSLDDVLQIDYWKLGRMIGSVLQTKVRIEKYRKPAVQAPEPVISVPKVRTVSKTKNRIVPLKPAEKRNIRKVVREGLDKHVESVLPAEVPNTEITLVPVAETVPEIIGKKSGSSFMDMLFRSFRRVGRLASRHFFSKPQVNVLQLNVQILVSPEKPVSSVDVSDKSPVVQNCSPKLSRLTKSQSYCLYSLASKWLRVQLYGQTSNKEIVRLFNKYHRLGYQEFSTFSGNLLNGNSLCEWIRKIAELEPARWELDGKKLKYVGDDIILLKKDIEKYFEANTWTPRQMALLE